MAVPEKTKTMPGPDSETQLSVTIGAGETTGDVEFEDERR